jgi:hypothetical protein
VKKTIIIVGGKIKCSLLVCGACCAIEGKVGV